MGLARNLSKFKPNSDGLVEAGDIATGAVTAEKIAEGAIPAGSGTNTFTASGSITAGKGVVLNNDGTVSEPTGSFTTVRDAYVRNPASGYYPEYTCMAVGDTHILAVISWANDPRSEYGYPPANYVAVKKSDDTASTPSTSTRVYYQSDSYFVELRICRLYYDSTNNKFLNFFIRRTSSTVRELCVQVVSVNSSNVISIESTTVLDSTSSSTTYLTPTNLTAASTTGGKYVVAYELYSDTASNKRQKLIAITVNGSSVSYGSPWDSGVQAEDYLGVGYFVNAQKIAFRYNEVGGGKLSVFTRSGNTLSLQATQSASGNALTIGFSSEYSLRMCPDDTNCNNIGNLLINSLSSSTINYLTISGNTVASGSISLPSRIDTNSYGFGVSGNTLGIYNIGNTFQPNGAYLFREVYVDDSALSASALGDFKFIQGTESGATLKISGVGAYNGYIAANKYFGNAYTSFHMSYGQMTTSKASASIGIAKQTVSNGESVEVTTVGGVNADVTGLSVGAKTYLTATGSPTLTATQAPIGTALSATSLLVKG